MELALIRSLQHLLTKALVDTLDKTARKDWIRSEDDTMSSVALTDRNRWRGPVGENVWEAQSWTARSRTLGAESQQQQLKVRYQWGQAVETHFPRRVRGIDRPLGNCQESLKGCLPIMLSSYV